MSEDIKLLGQNLLRIRDSILKKIAEIIAETKPINNRVIQYRNLLKIRKNKIKSQDVRIIIIFIILVFQFTAILIFLVFRSTTQSSCFLKTRQRAIKFSKYSSIKIFHICTFSVFSNEQIRL